MAISDEVRDRVRAQAGDRCGYCRSLQKYVLGILEIDHLIPTAKGGTDDEDIAFLMPMRYSIVQVYQL
jgi:5-methylcytosine-specific restriction endonuclease McrA